MNLKDAIEPYAAALKRKERSPRTIDWYRIWLKDLNNYLLFKDLEAITLTQLRCWSDSLIERNLKPSSRHGAARSAKVFFRWCVSEGYLTNDPAARLEVPVIPKRIPDTLTVSEVLALVNAAADSKNPVRDRTLVVFFTETGCRLSEVATLTIDRVNIDAGLAIVLGKGNKQRFAPFGEATQKLLREWLAVRKVEGLSLFGLTKWGIALAIYRVGERAGVRVSPHKFRRTSATLRAEAGAEVIDLQAIMGWEDVAMARIYVDQARLIAHARNSSPVDLFLRDRLNK